MKACADTSVRVRVRQHEGSSNQSHALRDLSSKLIRIQNHGDNLE